MQHDPQQYDPRAAEDEASEFHGATGLTARLMSFCSTTPELLQLQSFFA
jgi:hypothetical protein